MQMNDPRHKLDLKINLMSEILNVSYTIIKPCQQDFPDDPGLSTEEPRSSTKK